MATAIASGVDEGVEGNARLTGVTATVLLVALAVEGFTVIDVRQMIVVHLFVGLFLFPVTALKLASTGWRFLKYYRRDAAYVRKGPPHPILRILAPVVVMSTAALLGSGLALLIIGPGSSSRDTVLTIHQGSFIVWVATMTIHVIGHVLETFRLTKAEVGATRRQVVGSGQRTSVLAASLLLGVALGIASLSWNHSWKQAKNRDRRDNRGSALEQGGNAQQVTPRLVFVVAVNGVDARV
jgi:hypothetical protein